MLNLLTEFYELKLTAQQITESSVSGVPQMIIKNVLIQKANTENRNKRIYPRPILEREVTKYIETMVNANRALGELDHSNENVVNLKNVSHNIKRIFWDGDGVYADIEILDSPEFPAGRIAAGLLRRGIPVGISSRGMGSVEEMSEGISMVADDFSLLTWDLVSFESTIGSNFSLNEGTSKQTPNKYAKIDNILREILCNHSSACSCMFDKK